MDRLKQIWASYKELSFKQNTQSECNTSIKANSDNNLSREEHFSNTAQNLLKPLSTTSRPHLAQPIPLASSATIAKPLHTITTPSSANQQQPILTPQQLLRQLQQRHPTILTPSNPNTKLQESITESVTTNPATVTDSMTTMTKISKTTSAKEKSNNISNNVKTKATSVKLVQPNTKPNQTMSSAPTTTSVKYKKRTQTWPLPQSVTTIMTTAATKATISNNMMQARTIQHMIRNNMMAANNSIPAMSNMTPAQDKRTTQTLNKVVDMLTTQPPTTTPQPTNMIPQIQVQSPVNNNTNHKPQKPTTKSSHHRRHNQHQTHQRHRLAQEAARCLEAAQQQKAALNHERAVALWGQRLQVEQSAAENPICHNSPPRQLPKSNYVVQNAADNIELFDPFELEFSISSPSLLRSFSSETFTILSDEFDSLSEMSISPATTAIRRIPTTVGETSDRSAHNIEQKVAEDKKDGSANVIDKVKKVAVKK